MAANSSQLWAISPGAETWLLSLDTGGRAVVAALEDGTIRWFDRQTGAPVLNLYVHADLKRWVAWTGDAHFNGPAQASDLLHAFRFGGSPLDMPESVDPDEFNQNFSTPELLRKVFARVS